MTTSKRPLPSDYAPYHTLPGFDQGIIDYLEGRYDNPYTGPRDGLKAQAHDRGSEYAMRVIRWGRSHAGNPLGPLYLLTETDTTLYPDGCA